MPSPQIWNRKIVHIDMDAFFAAIEQRDRPELRGKPVIVGRNPEGRGVVSTASYEARRFGIHSAMPAAEAKRRCPEAIFLRPNIDKYVQVSNTIHRILSKYSSCIESAGIDEAYLDITENKLGIEDPVLLTRMIQQNIHAATSLSASAGVAPNKYLAKIASDMKKPSGLTVVYPQSVESFLKDLPVRKIPGVGPVTEKELHELRIKTIGDLACIEKDKLIQRFGKWGAALYDRARGIDNRALETESNPKQLGAEETFEKDLRDHPTMRQKIAELAEEVYRRLEEERTKARTVTLKVKYDDFTVITRSQTRSTPFSNGGQLAEVAFKLLLEKTEAGRRAVRLLGVSASHFMAPEHTEDGTVGDSMQRDLFNTTTQD